MSSRRLGKLGRRRFLTAVGAGVGGAALWRLAPWEAGAAPAQIRGTTLRLLMTNHFIPAFDEWFDRFAVAWGKANGVTVRVDHSISLQLPARIASELAAGTGHDLISFANQIQVTLYSQHLVDLTDFAERVGRKYGGWLVSARTLGVINGRWYAYPHYYFLVPMLYRKDLLDESGLRVPDTWDGWRAVARTLKPKNHPAGFAVSHCNDANHNWRSVLYDFGVQEADPSGKEPLWDSRDLREAMKFSKALWEEGMTSEVFSWDDASDNRYLDSGVACYIHDAISALRSIEQPNPALYAKIDVGNEPLGPKGRYNVCDPVLFSLWRFSKNPAAAFEFLEYYADHVKDSLIQSRGYNMPFLRDLYKKPMPVLGEDPKYALLQSFDKEARFFGFPGPVTAAASEVLSTFVVPDMLARYFRGGDLEGSIKWGMEQIQGIYAKYK